MELQKYRIILFHVCNIRFFEKVFWRKVLEIYATGIDYNPKAESPILFLKQVQNKMHRASHKHTAAELIYQWVDALSPVECHFLESIEKLHKPEEKVDFSSQTMFPAISKMQKR